MKRTMLRDRVRLILDKAAVVENAAEAWAKDTSGEEWRRRKRTEMLLAAVEFGEVARRYVGGKA